MKYFLFLILILLYCYIMKYMFFVILPFLLSFLLYYMIKPFIQKIKMMFHIQTNIIGIFILFVLYMFLIFILIVGGYFLFQYIYQWIEQFPTFYIEVLEPSFNELFPYIIQQDFLQLILNHSGQMIIKCISFISQWITQIPQFLFSFVLFILSSFFLMIDYDDIREKIVQNCSLKMMKIIYFVKENCLQTIAIYMKCQFLLIFVCFVILFFGFSILKINHPFLSSLLASFLDSLPFIGVGIIIFPMCIFYILKGYYLKAIYLVLLYLFINILRSLLEPRIMNKQMKIPSFVLLLSMIIHLYIFGMIGMILSPIHMNILYTFIDCDE